MERSCSFGSSSKPCDLHAVSSTFSGLCHFHTAYRYLTKISDQILCLMSDAQNQAFIWDHEEDNACHNGSTLDQIDKEDGDRMYTFEITQINEQEENVVSRQGFRVIHLVGSRQLHDD